MPPGIWNLGWLNANEQRNYPLSDDASCVDVTGAFTLPTSFLVALYVPVHAGLAVDPVHFYVSRVTVLGTGYGVAISYDDGTASPPVAASAVIARSGLAEFAAFDLPGVGDFADTLGKLVIGSTVDVDLQPPGEYFFTPAGGLLDTDAIRPIIRGVSSISVVNGQDASPALRGDIRLVAGDNIALSVVGGAIRVDAVDGSQLAAACECTGDAPIPPPIRTINGIPPDAAGDFKLVGSACIVVAPAANGVTLDNTCGTPCCGCVELQALTAELAHLGAEGATYKNYVDRLRSEQGQFNSVVLGSRLGDNPCVSC